MQLIKLQQNFRKLNVRYVDEVKNVGKFSISVNNIRHRIWVAFSCKKCKIYLLKFMFKIEFLKFQLYWMPYSFTKESTISLSKWLSSKIYNFRIVHCLYILKGILFLNMMKSFDSFSVQKIRGIIIIKKSGSCGAKINSYILRKKKTEI